MTVDLKQALSQYKTRVESYLRQRIDTMTQNDPLLHQAMAYGLLQGGKRMRPFLVYATGSLIETPLEELDAAAAALECIHSYSLIHDDLPAMDDDDLRRGEPTVHIKYDEATAILAGDALQSLAFEVLSTHNYQTTDSGNIVKMIQLLSSNSGYHGMCGGQALDLSHTNQSISLQQMQQMHRLKTGALIRSAVLMASYCGKGFNDEQRNQLNIFADNIGLAFQIQDDILDVIGDTEVMGKPKGSDEQANKSTYVALLGLEQAQQKAQTLYQQSIDALKQLPYDTQLLQAFAQYVVQRNH